MLSLQPSPESLKKVLGGKVPLMEGGQERPLPGGDAEGTFCVSLSKLLHLDEVCMYVYVVSRAIASIDTTTKGGCVWVWPMGRTPVVVVVLFFFSFSWSVDNVGILPFFVVTSSLPWRHNAAAAVWWARLHLLSSVPVQVQCVQVLHAFLRRRNSERPRGSPPASEGLDFTSQAFLFEVG